MVDFKSMHVLIIEDFENFSASLRDMVVFYGVPYDHIQIAATGEEALRFLKETRYDLVLSDYNLGEGRNGNDVLEEATHTKLIKSSCIYIMLTAENSMSMVMGALEYQPNEYLTKPFTKELLNGRLERLFKRRDAFMAIYKAIDQQQLDTAIAGCNKFMAEFPRYKSYLFKLKTDLMMQNESYGACLEIYRAVLKAKYLPWAQLGLGKCHYYLEQYEVAEQAFLQLIEHDKRFVPAWDWLAKTKKEQGDDSACQKALVEAVAISPRNVQRQTQLGHLAIKNGDLDVAEEALNQSVKFGKHSVHREPENYLELAKVMTERVKTVEPKEAKRMAKRASVMMEELRTIYRKDPKVAMQSRLTEGKFHQAQGNEVAAKHAFKGAFELCHNDDDGGIPAELKEQLVTALEHNDQSQSANQLVVEMQREESPLNAQAIALYEQGNLDEALKVLTGAVVEKPRSFAVNLNFAQVALHSMVNNGVDAGLMERVKQSFKQVQTLPRDDSRFELLKQLQSRYQKMEQG